MKIISTLFFVILFGVSTTHAQRIPPPKPVIVKLTSTMCNVCGLKAWDEFEDIIDKYEGDAVIMKVHPLEESDLFSNTATEYADNLPIFYGTPMLFTNEKRISNPWLSGVKEFVESYKQRTPVAHPFINFYFENNKLIVKIKTTFLKAVNRDYYLSVFVVENEVSAFQETRGPDEKHSKTLRTHLGNNVFGDLLSEEPIEKNQEFKSNFSIELDPNWNPDNLEIAVIIWEKRGDKFDFINANAALTPSSLTTSTNILEVADIKMSIQPTVISSFATIQLDLPSIQKGLKLTLINSLGQRGKNIFSGDLAQGNHSFIIDHADYGSGIYFLVLEKEGDRMVQKIILK